MSAHPWRDPEARAARMVAVDNARAVAIRYKAIEQERPEDKEALSVAWLEMLRANLAQDRAYIHMLVTEALLCLRDRPHYAARLREVQGGITKQRVCVPRVAGDAEISEAMPCALILSWPDNVADGWLLDRVLSAYDTTMTPTEPTP